MVENESDFNVADREQRTENRSDIIVSPISSAFAAAILEKHISRGGRVNIPTLGVTFPEQQVADNNLLNYLMSEEPHE